MVADVERDHLGQSHAEGTNLFETVQEFGFSVEQLTDGTRVNRLNSNQFFGGGKTSDESPKSPSLVIRSEIDRVPDHFAVSSLF